MADTNSVNTYAQFPNIDQMTQAERSMFMKEHDFESALSVMLEELNALLDTSTSSSSAITVASGNVQSELNVLTGRIESELTSLIKRYLEQISDEITQIEAAYERLYANIHSVISSINVNIQNRTMTYDVITSYKLRILDEVYKLFGKTSPYQDGRSLSDPKYMINVPNTLIRLRDIDEGIGWRSFPVIIDPTIKQDKIVKICEFTPLANKTGSIPTFLAELNIVGDLFAFKGRLTSTTQNRDNNFGKNKNRVAIFDADYFVNQDLPFALKVLYDKERNKVAIAFKFDDTSDEFTSIVKLDFSINLLVGNGLEFAAENSNTIMDGVGLKTYSTSVAGDEYIEIGDYPAEVTHGDSITIPVDAYKKYSWTVDFNGESSVKIVTLPGEMIDKDHIITIFVPDSSIEFNMDDISVSGTTITISNPSLYFESGRTYPIEIRTDEFYSISEGSKTIYKVELPSEKDELISVTTNGVEMDGALWDIDVNSKLLNITGINGNLTVFIKAKVTHTVTSA